MSKISSEFIHSRQTLWLHGLASVDLGTLWNCVQKILNVSAYVPFWWSRVYSFHQFLKEDYEAKLRTKSMYYHFSFLLACEESQTPSAALLNTHKLICISSHAYPLLFSEEELSPSWSVACPSDCVLSTIPSLLGSWDLTSLIDLFIHSLLSFPLIVSLSLNTWLLPFSL